MLVRDAAMATAVPKKKRGTVLKPTASTEFPMSEQGNGPLPEKGGISNEIIAQSQIRTLPESAVSRPR